MISDIKQVIWSLTRACPFKCKICCMMSSPNVDCRAELSSARKLAIAQELSPLDCFVDGSGGDPLYNSDLDFITDVIMTIGGKRVSISTTGWELNEQKIKLLTLCKGVDFTLDEVPDFEIGARHPSYTETAARGIEICVQAGINVSVVTVLTSKTMVVDNLLRLQHFLSVCGIMEWIWIPLYRVGRVTYLPTSFDPMLQLIEETVHSLDKNGIQPKLQHTIKHKECHAGIHTIWITPEGAVVSCPWAISYNGQPLKNFVMGNLKKESLSEIIMQNRGPRMTNVCIRDLANIGKNMSIKTDKAIGYADTFMPIVNDIIKIPSTAPV
jgi:MoaA/NifB/PqqE/SkfB family radical SAM enzyme